MRSDNPSALESDNSSPAVAGNLLRAKAVSLVSGHAVRSEAWSPSSPSHSAPSATLDDMNACQWFSALGLVIALIGAALGAVRGTWPPGKVPVAPSWEDADRQVRRVMNWLRFGLALIAIGTVFQIVGVVSCAVTTVTKP